MRVVVTSATTVALIAHALLGCCWHHAHAESAGGTAPTAAIKPVVHGNHVHFHGSSQDSHESAPADHEHDGQSCDDSACQFVADNRASNVSNSNASTCQWAQACLAYFTSAGASQLQDSFAAHRRPPDLTAGQCALYLTLRTLRI
jgi:hypothetical protein